MNLRATFPNFVDLVLNSGRWYRAQAANEDHRVMWNIISNLPVICDRVHAENFFGWAENYIGKL